MIIGLNELFLCSLKEVGVRGQSHRKANGIPPHQCRRFCRKMKQTKAGSGIVKSCSPFSVANCGGKNSVCQWQKGGDFRKKYYLSIYKLNRHNGRLQLHSLIFLNSMLGSVA